MTPLITNARFWLLSFLQSKWSRHIYTYPPFFTADELPLSVLDLYNITPWGKVAKRFIRTFIVFPVAVYILIQPRTSKASCLFCCPTFVVVLLSNMERERKVKFGKLSNAVWAGALIWEWSTGTTLGGGVYALATCQLYHNGTNKKLPL